MTTPLERKAKIVATLGPATESPEAVEALIRAGVDVMRVNLSHGTTEGHERVIRTVREVSAQVGRPVAILMDLQGPRIRTGKMDAPKEISAGELVSLVPEGEAAGDGELTTTYSELNRDVKPGDRVLIDDGLIELRVTGITDGRVDAEVVYGGPVKGHKGINLPGVDVSAPSLTERDMTGIDMGLKMGIDYLALSFVRRAADVARLKDYLKERGVEDVPVIAKIEKAEAIDSLDDILEISDGVMIARGDLGVELSSEKVPVLQKKIINRANEKDKLVITATQMLDSMINNPRPTRAEASDVANAVFDGTDALMLSGETAVGKYPVKSVEMMVRIIKEAEGSVEQKPYLMRRDRSAMESFSHAVCFAAYAASSEVKSRAIVVFTQSGATALSISKLRPTAPVIAFTPVDRTCTRLALVWGVRPLCVSFGGHTDEMICRGEAALLDNGLVDWGDRVVVVSGTKVGMRGATNMMKIDWIGSEECRVYLTGEKK
jgi:pyruvate kinase